MPRSPSVNIYNPQNEMLGDLETKRSKPKTKRTSWGTPFFLKKVWFSFGGMVGSSYFCVETKRPSFQTMAKSESANAIKRERETDFAL